MKNIYSLLQSSSSSSSSSSIDFYCGLTCSTGLQSEFLIVWSNFCINLYLCTPKYFEFGKMAYGMEGKAINNIQYTIYIQKDVFVNSVHRLQNIQNMHFKFISTYVTLPWNLSSSTLYKRRSSPDSGMLAPIHRYREKWFYLSSCHTCSARAPALAARSFTVVFV